MKKAIKKLMAAMLAAAMVLAMAIPAFAADQNGSITIEKTVAGETYTIYKIFTLDSFTTDGKYNYTVTSDWASFFDTGNPGADYIDLTNGHPTWKAADTAATKAAFAQAALSWAQNSSNTIQPTNSIPANSNTVVFNNLELGYYLVDTSLGALCNLTTTDSDATIEEKNSKPEIDKKIVEGTQRVDENSAKIGETVQYEVTVTVAKGAQNYIVRDTMTTGLTFGGSVTVTLNGNAVDAQNYDFDTSSSYTFTLAFHNDYIATLNAGDTLVISYSATVNDQAVIDSTGNTNTVDLKYGDDSSTTSEKVTTKVHEFDLVKVDKANNKLLDGAWFKLYASETGTDDEIKLVDTGNSTYRVATQAEIDADQTVKYIETNETKVITISGLADGTYWLEEVHAPQGYNPLDGRRSFTLNGDSIKTSMANTTTIWNEGDGGVKVENSTGTLLPDTGGIGTTIFYIVGGGLMIAAAVLLITKKRMDGKN